MVIFVNSTIALKQLLFLTICIRSTYVIYKTRYLIIVLRYDSETGREDVGPLLQGGRGCIIFPPTPHLFEKPCDTLAIQRLYGILYNIQYTLVLRIRIRPLVFKKYKNRHKKVKQKHCYVKGLFIVQS